MDKFWDYFRKTWMKRSNHHKDAGSYRHYRSHCCNRYRHRRHSRFHRHWIVPDLVLEHPSPHRREWRLSRDWGWAGRADKQVDYAFVQSLHASKTFMINRTNNPLERLNKKLKAEIPTHPTMQVSSLLLLLLSLSSSLTIIVARSL